MFVRCSACNLLYNDTLRFTTCPHDWFDMHTVMGKGGSGDVYVACTLADMDAIQAHYDGKDTTAFASIRGVEHRHTSEGRCLSRHTSGRLVQVAEQNNSVLLP